jgi:hypothetical protein
MHGEDEGIPMINEFFLCIPIQSRDNPFMVNDEILFPSKPSCVPDGAPLALVKGHVSLSLTGVHILTPPVAAHCRLPTVVTVLLTLEEEHLPPRFECVMDLLLEVLGLLNDF